MTGPEMRDCIIDAQEAFLEQHGRLPSTLDLPVRMAWDLAKCNRSELGTMSDRFLRDGITVLEREGFRGMKVNIIRRQYARFQVT